MPNRATVGIRGGDCQSVKSYFAYRSVRDLSRLRKIVILVGGNDLARRQDGVQIPNRSAQEVRQQIEGLIRYVKAVNPQAEVTTLDIIPRKSEGFFNSRARCVAAGIGQQTPDHHHISLLKGFIINSRVKSSERYRPKDLFYNGADGTHMNNIGYEVLSKIMDWILESSRDMGDSTRISVHDHEITVKMKF